MNAPLLVTGLLALTTVASCATTPTVPADPRQASAEVARLAAEAAQNPLLADSGERYITTELFAK